MCARISCVNRANGWCGILIYKTRAAPTAPLFFYFIESIALQCYAANMALVTIHKKIAKDNLVIIPRK